MGEHNGTRSGNTHRALTHRFCDNRLSSATDEKGKTMEDFAEYIVSKLYNLDSIMGHLRCYFDYEKYAHDLEDDYTLEDGYVFRTCG